MKEDFLHYVWKFQKLQRGSLRTVSDETVHIHNPGRHNLNAGPDFFNARLEIGGQMWAGNVEIHLKASDWYAHHHETDAAYENVILHVVWEYDADIYRKDGSVIPTLTLQEYVPKTILEQYRKLIHKSNKWIPCEADLPYIDDFVIQNWLERLYFERLERKEKQLNEALKKSKNHWEELLFRFLCKNFGLKINGESFLSIAESIPFSVVKKCSHNVKELEALLMGQAGLLDKTLQDGYFQELQSTYAYLKHKFALDNRTVIPPQFFRLRPPNFPTVRLSQFAALYARYPNLFTDLIERKERKAYYDFFDCQASEYWDIHYNFGVESGRRRKRLTTKFIDLLIINTVLPVKFAYARYRGEDILDQIIEIASEIDVEENSIIQKFNAIRPLAKNAFQSQALLELKNEYCNFNRCLQCAIGNVVVGNSKSQTP